MSEAPTDLAPGFTDLSHLPRAQPAAVEGLAPDAEPRFAGVLVEKWATTRDDDKPTAMGTKFRHSDAGKCARAISYAAAGIPRSDPMDLTGVWNTSLGTLIHDLWQAALLEKYPDAEIESKVGWDDFDGSAHIDAVIRTTTACGCMARGATYSNIGDPDHDGSPDECPDCFQGERPYVISYELKTVGGYAFKSSIGKIRRGSPAEGPKSEHLAQASLNAMAINADEAVIGYLAKETLSVKVGAGLSDLNRLCAEWTFDREQYEPIAQAEKARVAGILELVEGGELAARKIPDLGKRAEITDPATGAWQERDANDEVVDLGSWWACGYCSWQTVCTTTEAGRIPIESVVTIGASA